MRPVDRVLMLLDDVRDQGTGWRATCPNGHKKRNQLNIKEGDDGRVLMHCHAGCDWEEVLSALGLQKKDLFVPDPQLSKHAPSTDARARKQQRGIRQLQRSNRFRDICTEEVSVAWIAADKVLQGVPLTQDDVNRVRLCHKRLGQVFKEIDDAR